jgi:hypothetical protein
MKVTLKVDAEFVPIIIRAINEYTERSLAGMVVSVPVPSLAKPATKPASADAKTTKKRGRPRGSKTKKATVTLAAPAAVTAQAA